MRWKDKSWITIWLVLVCVALMVTGSYAAYTKVEYVKRVVATKDGGEKLLFSSNYLLPNDEYRLRTIPIGTRNDLSVTVTVCNYLQSDLTQFSEESITYTITAELVDGAGKPIALSDDFSYVFEGVEKTIKGEDLAKQITITCGEDRDSFEDGTYAGAEKTLPGGEAASHLYTISCDSEYIPIFSEIGIKMSATPKSTTIDKRLTAQLWFGASSLQPTPWQGRFERIEALEGNQSTTGFDAFNYTISGTQEQTLQLSWNAEKVTLGKWSCEELGNPEIKNVEGKNNWKYIEIYVGQAGSPTSYTLQFYRVKGIPDNETATDVLGYVAYK